MRVKWQYPVSGVVIGGAVAVALHLFGIASGPASRNLSGVALILLGGLAGTLLGRSRGAA